MKIAELIETFKWSRPNQARSMARYGSESLYSSGYRDDTNHPDYVPPKAKKKKIYNTPEDKVEREAFYNKYRARGPRDA